MKLKFLLQIAEEAERLGWKIVKVYRERFDGEYYHVVVHRENAPFPHLAYSSHIFTIFNKSFFSGVYDLTLEEALEVTRQRAGYDKPAVEE